MVIIEGPWDVLAAIHPLPSVLAAVPPVLDCVVASSVEPPGDFCPPLSDLEN